VLRNQLPAQHHLDPFTYLGTPTSEDIRATLTICLLASFADGEKHDREREQIRQVAEGLAGDQRVNLPGLYQDVLLRRVQLPTVLASSPPRIAPAGL
jgi:hypothetical protein